MQETLSEFRAKLPPRLAVWAGGRHPLLHRRPPAGVLVLDGFARSDLLALVNELGGRALDRIVPIGQALQFQRHWDGHDLMGMMSKVLTVSGGRAG